MCACFISVKKQDGEREREGKKVENCWEQGPGLLFKCKI